MTSSDDTTMVPSKASNPSFKTTMHPNKSKQLKASVIATNVVEQMHSHTNTKFNLMASMHTFLTELVEHEPSILVVNLVTMTQLVVVKDLLLTNKIEFKKLFMVLMDMHASMKQQHIIIRCHMMSEQTCLHDMDEEREDLHQIGFSWHHKNDINWLPC